MKEYEIDPDKSYYENRQRLVDEGHVMGISYLPLTYEDVKDMEVVEEISRCAIDLNRKYVGHLKYEA